MNFSISQKPGSIVLLELAPGEKVITEKGALIYCSGSYTFENKMEAGDYKNWIAKLFSGKSLSYNIYTAVESFELAIGSKDSSEIFCIEVAKNKPILIEPSLHVARSYGLDLVLDKTDWKTTLNDGLKLKTEGSGLLFLKGYGQIMIKELDTEQPFYIDETALIAFDANLQVKTITKSIKETITSGEGALFAISGKGTIWLQTRKKPDNTQSDSLIGTAVGFIK